MLTVCLEDMVIRNYSMMKADWFAGNAAPSLMNPSSKAAVGPSLARLPQIVFSWTVLTTIRMRCSSTSKCGIEPLPIGRS